jgi:hypothetical protein
MRYWKYHPRLPCCFSHKLKLQCVLQRGWLTGGEGPAGRPLLLRISLIRIQCLGTDRYNSGIAFSVFAPTNLRLLVHTRTDLSRAGLSSPVGCMHSVRGLVYAVGV